MARNLSVFTAVAILISVGLARAQSVDVKDLKTDGDKTTTIEIRKGDKEQKTDAQWEVIDGHADIMGDHNSVKKEARADWKKACETWIKEFKSENKENKIINVSCGSPNCVSETEGILCKSQGSYKIKTRVN